MDMHTEWITRPAQAADIPLLSEYWYDKMVLAQQMNAPLRLLPDARTRWEKTAQRWAKKRDVSFIVAEKDGDCAGCIVGAIMPNAPGLAPENIGRVWQLVIDLHTPQRGAGRVLLGALRQRFATNDVTQIRVDVMPHLAVERAFWQAQGARPYRNAMILT